MAKTMTGTWGPAIVALLDPNSDLLEEILQIARDHKINAAWSIRSSEPSIGRRCRQRGRSP